MKYRFLSALLALLLLTTACSRQDEAPAANSMLASAYVYEAEYAPLIDYSRQMGSITASCVSGEAWYFTAWCSTGGRVDGDGAISMSGQTSLFLLDQDTGDRILLADHRRFLPKDAAGGALDVLALAPGPENTVWAAQRLHSYTVNQTAGTFTGGTHPLQLCRYDAQGEILECMETALPETAAPQVLQLDAGGRFYLSDYETCWLLTPSGQELQTVSMESSAELCAYGGQVGVVCSDGPAPVFRPLGPSGDWGEAVTLWEGAARVYPGVAPYAYLFDCNGDALYGWNAETDQPERLLTWSDYGVECRYLVGFTVREDGQILAATAGGIAGPEAVTLTRIDPSQLPERAELTMACLSGTAWEMREPVTLFNRSRQDIHISLQDYSEFGDAQETILNTEILAGHVPDLICAESMTLGFQADKGVLRDLWPMIDCDEDLGREALMAQVFDVMSKDGELYGIAPFFSIWTMAVRSEFLPDQPGWTLEELQQAAERAGNPTQVLGWKVPRDGVLFRLVGHNSGEFLDLKNGTCAFESQKFLDILNFARTFPAEPEGWEEDDTRLEAERFAQGEQLSVELQISTFPEFQYTLKALGPDVRFVGFPSQSGASYFRLPTSLGISVDCQKPEAAWEFARTLLTEHYQSQDSGQSPGFPTNKKAFQSQADKAMTHSEKVYDRYGLSGSQESIFMPQMTREVYERFLALYESCNRTMGYNDAVMSVVLDEAYWFFDGQKSAEDTAAVIQKRVGLYLDEQFG